MIVFLDKDGVFETSRCYAAGMKIDPVAVEALNRAFALPNVIVVVSASFRKIMKSREEAEEYLQSKGIQCQLHQHWKTPSAATRSLEIKQWLLEHGEPHYIVIDDEYCDPNLLNPLHFVKCSPSNCMYLAAIAKLRDLTQHLDHKL